MEKTKINDKIKFWEEQDKINQALIPRIFEMHEHIKNATLLAQKNSSNFLNASAENKVLHKKIEKTIEEFNELTLTTKNSVSSLNTQFEILKLKVNTYDSKITDCYNKVNSIAIDVDAMKNNLKNLDYLLQNQYSKLFIKLKSTATAALILAVLALIISLISIIS